MHITELDSLEIQSPRSHFVNIMEHQSDYINNHKEMEANSDFLKEISINMNVWCSGNRYYMLEDDRLRYMLLLKLPTRTRVCSVVCPKFVENYELKHLYSSIIAHIILLGDKTTTTVVRSSIFILYYYWFFKGKSIGEISANVCADIESIIKLLIDRQYTTYKDKDISTPVDMLALRLRNEKLLGNSKLPKTINLRR